MPAASLQKLDGLALHPYPVARGEVIIDARTAVDLEFVTPHPPEQVRSYYTAEAQRLGGTVTWTRYGDFLPESATFPVPGGIAELTIEPIIEGSRVKLMIPR